MFQRLCAQKYSPGLTPPVWHFTPGLLHLGLSILLSYQSHTAPILRIPPRDQQTNGTLGKGLRCLSERTPAAWSSCLPWIEHVYNSLPVVLSCLQCIQKVFTALHFFHILLCYSLIPKWNTFVLFFSQNSTNTTHHNDNMKKFFLNVCKFIKNKKKSHVHNYSQPLLNTLLMHLWHQLQPQVFLNMMPQAWHTYLWAVLPITLCSTSQAPSSWMEIVGAQPFSDLSRDVQSDSSL